MQPEQETWKEIPNTSGFYEVSDMGRVRSWRNARWGKRSTPYLLGLSVGNHGYYQVSLSMGKLGVVKRTVHSLVCEVFIGPPGEGEEVLHIDSNKTNNNLRNLKYGTHAQNIEDNVRLGLHKRCPSSTWTTKLTWEDVDKIRSFPPSVRNSEVARLYPVTETHIGRLRKGFHWDGGWNES